MSYPVIPTDDDEAHFTAHKIVDTQLRKRITMERMVVRKACRDAIAAGLAVTIDYGDGENGATNSTDLKEIMANIQACDEEWLRLSKDGKPYAVIFLVYGNDGWDVINDYHTKLDDVLKGANELADKLADN